MHGQKLVLLISIKNEARHVLYIFILVSISAAFSLLTANDDAFLFISFDAFYLLGMESFSAH